MEKCINSQILKYLEKHDCHDRQYGFRQQRSTADLLTLIGHHWNRLIKFGMPHFLNFHLTASLPNCVPGLVAFFPTSASVSWWTAIHLNFHPINTGVPQGSVLAPTLFLHINDLLSATTNPIHSYADDSTLHSNIQSPQTSA